MELQLSEYERGYLTAEMNNLLPQICEERDWHGVMVGDRMFDLCFDSDEDGAGYTVTACLCLLNDEGQYYTDPNTYYTLRSPNDE